MNGMGLMERTKLGEEIEAPRLSRFLGMGHVPANRNLVEIIPSPGLSDNRSKRVRYLSTSE